MSRKINVELMDHMGDDASVVNAARVSFDSQGKSTVPLTTKDERLIHYLAQHKHWTPFAHTSLSLRVTAPIMVRTQCFKHKVGLVENEVSRRYVDNVPEVFEPFKWRGRPEGSIKQGSSDPIDDQETANKAYKQATDFALSAYQLLLDIGVAPEQARMVLPQAAMTTWIWTGSLAAFARFCGQRLSPDAQAETRQVALGVAMICRELFPVSWEALKQAHIKEST